MPVSGDASTTPQLAPMPFVWRAFFLLIPFGLLVFSRLVVSDLPALLIIMTGMFGLVSGGIPALNRIDIFFIGFVGFSALGQEIPATPGDYVFEMFSIIFLYCVFRAVAGFVASEERLQQAASLLAFSLLLIISVNFISILLQNLGVVDLVPPDILPDAAAKLSWPFQFSGQLGIALTILFPLCVTMLGRSLPVRMLLYMLFLINCGATGSRSVFWLSVFEILYAEFFVFRNASGPFILLKSLAVICAIAGPLLFLAGDFSFQRSLGQSDNSPLFFDAPRYEQIIMALKALPVWLRGMGLGCFSPMYKTEIHNTPLNLIVEAGFPGFALSCLIFFEIARAFLGNGKRGRSALHAALLMALLATVFHGLFRNLLTNRTCWFALALCFSYGLRPGTPAVSAPDAQISPPST